MRAVIPSIAGFPLNGVPRMLMNSADGTKRLAHACRIVAIPGRGLVGDDARESRHRRRHVGAVRSEWSSWCATSWARRRRAGRQRDRDDRAKGCWWKVRMARPPCDRGTVDALWHCCAMTRTGVYISPMARARASTERVQQKGRTRRALLAAAVKLVTAGAQPSVADVADAAEVSRRTAYRYFPTQEQMLVEAALEGVRGIMSQAIEGDDSPRVGQSRRRGTARSRRSRATAERRRRTSSCCAR